MIHLTNEILQKLKEQNKIEVVPCPFCARNIALQYRVDTYGEKSIRKLDFVCCVTMEFIIPMDARGELEALIILAETSPRQLHRWNNRAVL